MTSRPDVMQLLFFFFSSEKHRLTRKEEKCEGRETTSVMWSVCMSELLFHFKKKNRSSNKHRSLVCACMENKCVTPSAEFISEVDHVADRPGFTATRTVWRHQTLKYNSNNVTERELLISSLTNMPNHNVPYHGYFRKSTFTEVLLILTINCSQK